MHNVKGGNSGNVRGLEDSLVVIIAVVGVGSAGHIAGAGTVAVVAC